MAPENQDISSDWQTNCTGTEQRIARLYQTEEWTDCCFEFDDQIIKAHKLILSMSSPVFASMFYGGLTQNDNPIAVADIQSGVFTTLLKYIYTAEVNINSLEIACGLYYAAKKYELPHLMKECVTYITSNLAPDNVCQLYEFANLHDEMLLMDMCLQMFSTKTLDIFSGNSFEKAEVSTMNRILSMDHLNILSELDLLEGLAKYVKSKRKRNWLVEKNSPAEKFYEISEPTKGANGTTSTSQGERDATASQELKLGEKRLISKEKSKKDYSDIDKSDGVKVEITASQIRSMLCKIRFLTLSPKEFANYNILNVFLTKDEIFSLSMNIASRDTLVPMPTGFCTNRLPRRLLCFISMGSKFEVDKAHSDATLRFTIHNFSNLEDVCSPLFYVRDLPWNIRIHLLGQVFLFFSIECNKESESSTWSCRAYTDFLILSHNRDTEPLCCGKTWWLFSRKTQRYSSYVSCNDILDPEEGYVKNDSVIFEVHLTADEPQEHVQL